MSEKSPNSYRRIWPFEPSEALDFIAHDILVDHSEYRQAQRAYVDLFARFHENDFLPANLTEESKLAQGGPRRLLYRVVTDACSDIQVEFIRYVGEEMNGSQIMVQDRLLAKVRNQYVYCHLDDGVIRICDGDVAAQAYDISAYGGTNDGAIDYSGEYVSAKELVLLGELLDSRGERIITDGEDEVVSLLDRLAFEDATNPSERY